MEKLKINDSVDILINEVVYRSKVREISIRETDREIMTYYSLDNLDKDSKISVSISTIEDKNISNTLNLSS